MHRRFRDYLDRFRMRNMSTRLNLHLFPNYKNWHNINRKNVFPEPFPSSFSILRAFHLQFQVTYESIIRSDDYECEHRKGWDKETNPFHDISLYRIVKTSDARVVSGLGRTGTLVGAPTPSVRDGSGMGNGFSRHLEWKMWFLHLLTLHTTVYGG